MATIKQTNKTFAPFFTDYYEYYQDMNKNEWYEFTKLIFDANLFGEYPDEDNIKSKKVKLYWKAVKNRIKANNYKYNNRAKNNK